MTAAAVQLPPDPAERRRLWREWTRTDSPRVQASPVRRSKASIDLWADEAIDAPASVTAGLRRAVEEAIVDGHLAIADRERLLRRAERLGLRRFEASLLIAALQHRAAEGRAVLTVRSVTKRSRQPRSLAAIVSGCVVLEAVAAAGLAMWLRA